MSRASNRLVDRGHAEFTPLAVSVQNAARMAGIGKTTFYQLLAENRGPKTFMLGGRRLVRVESMNVWLAKLEQSA